MRINCFAVLGISIFLLICVVFIVNSNHGSSYHVLHLLQLDSRAVIHVGYECSISHSLYVMSVVLVIHDHNGKDRIQQDALKCFKTEKAWSNFSPDPWPWSTSRHNHMCGHFPKPWTKFSGNEFKSERRRRM